ncbi:MAG: T9SS type A sorting domain-containing protein [Taibaiella sp.]|nr:T9SS type A sorting domain-containing protein [Taibaiella sp.]
MSCILLLAGLSPVAAQSGIVKSYFAEAKNDKVYLRWIMAAGNTCNGIEISRSTDGANYTLIGNIYGVCGSEDTAQTFEFTDENPLKNKTNFYRLTFGSLGATETRSVFVISETDYILYPNPASTRALLLFENNAANTATLVVYDIAGRQVHKSVTKADITQIEVSYLPAGIYPFVLSLQGKMLRGKLRVLH